MICSEVCFKEKVCKVITVVTRRKFITIKFIACLIELKIYFPFIAHKAKVTIRTAYLNTSEMYTEKCHKNHFTFYKNLDRPICYSLATVAFGH